MLKVQCVFVYYFETKDLRKGTLMQTILLTQLSMVGLTEPL